MDKKSSRKKLKSPLEIRSDKFSHFFSTLYANTGRTIFSERELDALFLKEEKMLRDLRMASYSSVGLLRFLVQKAAVLKEIALPVQKGTPSSKQLLYHSKEFIEKDGFSKALEIAVLLFPKGYLTHYTAMYLHGLTGQVPKTIFVNTEQRMMYSVEDAREDLDQKRIDAAFSKNIERGRIVTEFEGYQIRRIHGKDTGGAGVVRLQTGRMNVSVTNVERTLIDIAVHPGLSGGIHEVIKAYENTSQNLTASITKLIHYLKQIDYVYPYYQAIGFLLQKAKYGRAALDALKEQFSPFQHDFYLLHSPTNKDKQKLQYISQWRLFVPTDLL